MFLIRIRFDPFHFGQPDPDPFYEMDPGGKKSSKIKKNYKNHKNIIYFFENVKLLFNEHKYLPHKYIFDRKKSWYFPSILILILFGKYRQKNHVLEKAKKFIFSNFLLNLILNFDFLNLALVKSKN